MRWSGEELVFQSSRGLRLFSTRTGERRTIDVGGSLFRRTLVGPTESGELHLFKAREESGGILQRVDVARAVLGPEVALEGTDRTWYARRALSPSGRFWLRPSRESTPGVVVDLDSGAELASFGRWGVWLAGDRLAWVVREPGRVALRVGDPGAGDQDVVGQVAATRHHREGLVGNVEIDPAHGMDLAEMLVDPAEPDASHRPS